MPSSLTWGDVWWRGYDSLRGLAPGLVPLALLVGAGAGVGAVVFRYRIVWFTELGGCGSQLLGSDRAGTTDLFAARPGGFPGRCSALSDQGSVRTR